MPVVYRDQMDLAKDPAFIQRVKMALVNSANTIYNEAGGTANHIQRAAFARQVLNNPDMYAPIMAVTCAADGVNFPAVITRDASGNVLTSNGSSSGVDNGLDGKILAVWSSFCVS
jgi:hypothetical protein